MPPSSAIRPSDAAAPLTTLADDVLFEACRAGDDRAFRVLVDRHGALVRRLAMNIVHDEQEAEDVAQEAFVCAWKSRQAWKPEAKFTTWLYRIAVNKAIDRYRARRTPTLSGEVITRLSDAAVARDTAPAQQQALERQEVSATLRQALEKLPRTQRTALLLFYFEDLDVANIATRMLTSEQSVRALLKRGRQALKTTLQKQKTHPAHGSLGIFAGAGDLRG